MTAFGYLSRTCLSAGTLFSITSLRYACAVSMKKPTAPASINASMRSAISLNGPIPTVNIAPNPPSTLNGWSSSESAACVSVSMCFTRPSASRIGSWWTCLSNIWSLACWAVMPSFALSNVCSRSIPNNEETLSLSFSFLNFWSKPSANSTSLREIILIKLFCLSTTYKAASATWPINSVRALPIVVSGWMKTGLR